MRPSPRYPDAPREERHETPHGRRVSDPYRWLEEPADPRTIRWSAEQETLYQAHRAAWPGIERWHEQLAGLSATDVWHVPRERGGRVFAVRQGAGQDHPVVYFRDSEGDRPLLDVRVLDPSGRSVLESWEPSLEGDRIAYLLSRDGTEDAELWVLDVASGQLADGPLNRVRRSTIAWLPGGKAFYYVARLSLYDQYNRRVYLHHLGGDRDTDPVVFGEGRDPTQFYTVASSTDGRWLTVTATTGTDPGTEIYLADLSAASPEKPELRRVQEAAMGRARTRIEPGTGPQDPIWLRTHAGAPRGRVVVTTPVSPQRWRELIAERPEAVLDDFAVLKGAALGRPIGLASWIRHAAAEITIHDLATGAVIGEIPLPGKGSVGRLATGSGPGHEAWFSYTDYVTPPQVLHYDARSAQVSHWSPQTAASGPNPVVSMETCHSADGTAIRLFVVSPGAEPDVSRPTILTGYGGFGVSMSPRYSPLATAWVRAGGVFVTACLRGGGEEGRQWHHDGRGARKQNTFDDFAAAAGHLVSAGWTTSSQLGILGTSNGGLLIGAALTQHPQRYAAAVCISALLDMARYELHGRGPSWVPEYGSIADPDQARTLLAYSPYHQVKAGEAYPPVLLAAAGGDTRVDALHARKMCAALQHASAGTGPILLRYERDVGHGLRAASSAVELYGDCLAFLAAQLGVNPVQSGKDRQ
jgi:prolyl oligopeptidase